MKKQHTTPSPADSDLVTGQSIAQRLRLCDRAFRTLLAEGLPHYRINARVFRYRWSEVEAWLGQRRVG